MTCVMVGKNIAENHNFVDEQHIGPYTIWYHKHFIEPSNNSVLMTDKITWKILYGFIGTLVNYFSLNKNFQKSSISEEEHWKKFSLSFVIKMKNNT